MKCLRKFFASLIVCILLVTTCLSLSVFAEGYSDNFPSYIPQHGGAYIEVQSRELGTGALVFSIDKRFNVFTITGDSYDLFNMTSSTVSGTFYKTNGTSYPVRFSATSNLQYRPSTTVSTYSDLHITNITNTNCEIIDVGGILGNTVTVIDHTQKPIYILLIILIVLFTFHNFYDVAKMGDKK